MRWRCQSQLHSAPVCINIKFQSYFTNASTQLLFHDCTHKYPSKISQLSHTQKGEGLIDWRSVHAVWILTTRCCCVLHTVYNIINIVSFLMISWNGTQYLPLFMLPPHIFSASLVQHSPLSLEHCCPFIHLQYRFYTHLWLSLCGCTFFSSASCFQLLHSSTHYICIHSILPFTPSPQAHLPSSFFCQMYDSWFQRSDWYMNILRGPNINFLEGNKEGDGEWAVIGV